MLSEAKHPLAGYTLSTLVVAGWLYVILSATKDLKACTTVHREQEAPHLSQFNTPQSSTLRKFLRKTLSYPCTYTAYYSTLMNNHHWSTETPRNHTKETRAAQNPTTPHPTQQHKEKQKAQPLADCTSVALYNMVRAFPYPQGSKPKTP